jgi:hypothetical protein
MQREASSVAKKTKFPGHASEDRHSTLSVPHASIRHNSWGYDFPIFSILHPSCRITAPCALGGGLHFVLDLINASGQYLND